jgi:transposase
LRVQQDLATLDQIVPQIEELDTELRRLSTSEQSAEQVAYLVQLPGIGLLTAMTILSPIGDITRFGAAKSCSAMPDLARGCMTVARPIATKASPNKAGAI